MELRGQYLFVTIAELAKLSVLENTVRVGIARSRKLAEKTRYWKSLKIAGLLHIDYASIPPETARATELPSAAVVWARFQAEQNKQAHLHKVGVVDKQLAYAVEMGWQAFVSGFTHQLSPADAEPYARLQAALNWSLANTPRPYTRLDVLPAFQGLGLPVGQVKSYALFTRKLSNYAEVSDKVAFLLARRGAPSNNTNRLLMGPEQKKWLINRFADYMKPSHETTWADYKAHIKTNGLDWPKLSLPTVRQMLDKNRPAWEPRRHGVAAAEKRVGYVLKKEKPSEPDLLLEFDGTQEPFFYRNELGLKDGRVYSVRLWDMHSDCIVGSAYGVTEDADLVRAAVQDYLLRQRRQPHQFRYDKGAANLSQAVQELLAATGALKFASTAKRPTARRSEKLLGQFQHQCQRDLRGFRGSNRTSDRNLDMKVHPDRLEREWKTEKWESIVAQCQQAEEEWNNSPYAANSGGVTRWERYQQQGPKGRKLSLERLAELLFVERKRPVRYSTHCLEIEVPDGTRHHFEPQTAPGIVHLEVHRQLAGEAPKLRVWEMQDGSREIVLARRADNTGGWLEMGKKCAWPEAQADMAPGQQRAHQALLLADANDKQRLLANEDWRAELGPNDQSKESWNEAELTAELAEAGRAERPAVRPKRPPKPAALPSAGSSWFLNNL